MHSLSRGSKYHNISQVGWGFRPDWATYIVTLFFLNKLHAQFNYSI